MRTLPAPLPHVVSDIGQIAIRVSDGARAMVFCRDVLGLKLLFPAGPNLTFFAAGAVGRRLTPPPESGEIGGKLILYLKVKDVVAMHAAMVAGRAANERAPPLTAKMPDHALWIGFGRDPDGNLVGLREERR